MGENSSVHANHRPASTSPTLFFPLKFQRNSCKKKKKMCFLCHQREIFRSSTENKGGVGFQQFPLCSWNPSLLASHIHMTLMTAPSEHLTIFQTLIFPAFCQDAWRYQLCFTASDKWQYRNQALETQKDSGILWPSMMNCVPERFRLDTRSDFFT